MNNLAKVGGVTGIFALMLDLVPAQYAIYPAALIAVCAILSALIQPPAATSKWTRAYSLMTAIGANVGWALNRLRPGVTGVDVRREDASLVKAAAPALIAAARSPNLSTAVAVTTGATITVERTGPVIGPDSVVNIPTPASPT